MTFTPVEYRAFKMANTFLGKAEDYAIVWDDQEEFKRLYRDYRAHYGVLEATWKTLQLLYGAELADKLLKHCRNPSFDSGIKRC